MEAITQRNLMLDIIKGIGILLMVYRHARGPYSDYVLLFHMALFFLASGYLYNEKSIKYFNKFIQRKLQALWFPFFLTNTIFMMLGSKP